jgi:hypothetical protein
MIDSKSKQVIPQDQYVLHRFQRRLCDICVFVHRTKPRVFVGGGQFGYDGLVREADVVEIEALAELCGITRLRDIAAERHARHSPIDDLMANPADATRIPE